MANGRLDVLRRWFDAFDRDDLDGARELFAPDAVLHVTAPAEIAGDYVGFDEFLEFYSRKRQTADATFAYRVEELMEGPQRVAAVLTLSTKGTNPREWLQIALYRIEGDQIREIWFVEDVPPRSDL